MATQRAAVLIGIENIAGLASLPGAVAGANEMADWATSQGWDSIKLFTDKGGRSVTHGAVYQHIDGLVQKRSLKQLLIYFAGHGQCWGVDSDFWILSGTSNPGDVVNVHNSVALARQSGVPLITIIADACRSIGAANDAAISQIAFPLFAGRVNPASKTKLDQFYATKPTQAAIEVNRRIEEENQSPNEATSGVNTAVREAHGVFTNCLLAALRGEADAAKTRLSDDRIVVQPQRLSEFLEHQVPREAGRVAGFAQKPDCRPQTDQVLAEVQAAAQFQLQIEVMLSDESPAEGTTLELLRYEPSHPDLLVPQRRIRSYSLSEQLPRGNTYGVQATLAGHHQQPASPNPMTLLMGDTKVEIKLLPDAAPPITTRGPRAPGGSDEPTLDDSLETTTRSFDINKAVVLTDDGQQFPEAPSDGVFSIQEVDGITGDVYRSRQFLRHGNRPQRLKRPGRPAERAVREAARRSVQDHDDSDTDLTLAGVQEVQVYDSYEQTQASRANNLVHVRGPEATSSSLVVDLGDGRFAALARLRGYVGHAHVTALGVENLSYLPARGAGTKYGETGEETPEFRLRAQTAMAIAEAAARHGEFDLAIDEARPVAKTLRWYKHYNPVLGVFAAYAYHQAGASEQIRDMIGYFTRSNQTVPFDVYLLSGMSRDEISSGVAPGYPLLTQGWLQLGSDLHPAVEAARRSMAPTLWATIMGDAGRELGEAVARGELK